MSAKTCEHCHQDCSNKPRVKDPSGHYYCKECYPAAQKAAAAAKGTSGALVSNVFEEPIIPTAEMVVAKDEPKKAAKDKDLPKELPPKNCPNCGVQMPATGVVCTNCGFNITSKKAIKTKIEKALAAPKESSRGSSYTGNYAGFWRRFVAAIVDGIVVIVMTVAVMFVCMSTFADPSKWDAEKLAEGEIPGDLLAVYGIIILVNWFYFSLMESSAAQATLGRKLMGISVGTTDGGMVSFVRSSARYWLKTILYSIPFAGFLVLLVNIAMVLAMPRKQTVYDLATGVVVVQ